MLRLIGLVVVVLLVLSLAHGERTRGDAEANARAETMVDAVTGRLADGVGALGDMLFGPGARRRPSAFRDLPGDFDSAVRAADARSRRDLAAMVLRSCPSLGLACQPAANRLPGLDDRTRQDGRSGGNDRN